MVEIAIPFNRRSVYFAQRRQHLVNHGLQRDVNHSQQTPHRYFRLTQNIKRIPTRFWHDWRVTRHKSRARESFEASMRSGGCGRVGPCSTARPFRLACAVLCRRGGCRRVGARRRTSLRTRRHAARAARHAHGPQYAGRRFRRHLVVADARRLRLTLIRSHSRPPWAFG